MTESLLNNSDVTNKYSGTHAYTVNELQKENLKRKKSGWNKVKQWNTKHRYKVNLGDDQEVIKSGYYFMIWVHCEDITSLDLITPSDPIDFNTGMYYELGRTEILRDTNNPIFHTPFLVNKSHIRLEKSLDELEAKEIDINEVSPFEKVVEPEPEITCLDSPIGRFVYSLLWGKLEIKQVENKNNNLRLVVADVDEDQFIHNKQVIGTIEFNLETILEDESNSLSTKLHLGEKKTGTAHLIVEAVLNEKYLGAQCLIRIGASGVHRNGKNLYPFLVISRQLNNLKNNWFPVYRTEIINEKNSSEPFWQDIVVDYLYLCNGEEDTLLRFELFHFNTLHGLPKKLSRPHELLSSIDLRVSDLNRVNTEQKTDYMMKDKNSFENIRLHIFRYEMREEGFNY